MQNKLAIIIPAYKSTFLRQSLESIANQTCKDFTLYIGDDCSPYQLWQIVDEYRDKLDIVYKRFDSNLGGKDLVAQWERCIAMSKDEPYIWLFSDDDVMEKTCVESFYTELKKIKDKYDLFHFNVKKIDNNGNVIQEYPSYPQDLDSYTYYKGKLQAKYVSLVVENIFTRDVYNKFHGFKNFDLAWGSDTATWTMYASRKGFYTIPKSKVLWRSSDLNITPNVTPPIVKRKVNALLNFFEWGYNFFYDRKQSVFWINVRAYINRMSKFHVFISDSEFRKATNIFCKIHHCYWLYVPLYLFIKSRKR